MKRKIRYLLPALLFLLGAAILLYPPLSSFWNQRRQDTQIAAYRQTMAALDAADRAAQRAAAQAYNDGLPRDFHDAFTGRQPPEDDLYWSLLDPNGTGVMGDIWRSRRSVCGFPLATERTRTSCCAASDTWRGLRFRSAGRGPIAFLPATADYPPPSC